MTATTAVPRAAPRGFPTRVGRAVLTALAWALYVLGWTAGLLWLVVSWPVLAMMVGFRDATARRGGR